MPSTTSQSEKLVATTIAMPEPAPPYGVSQHQFDGPVSWAISAVAGFVATLLYFRRKVSRDSTEITKDKAESNLVQTLRDERNEAMNAAREAWDRRTTDAEEIAGLRKENEYLKRDVAKLTTQVDELKAQLAVVFNALRTMKPDFAGMLPPTQSA